MASAPQKRSIFEEVGAEGSAQGSAPVKVEISRRHSLLTAIWLGLLALVLAGPALTAFLPLMQAMMLRALLPLAALGLWVLGAVLLLVLRKIPQGMGRLVLGLGLLLAATAAAPLAAQIGLPIATIGPETAALGLLAFALAVWGALTAARAPVEILAARRAGAQGLARAGLLLAALAGFVILAPQIFALAVVAPYGPVALAAAALLYAGLARRSALGSTRGAAYLALALALALAGLTYVTPSLPALPLIQALTLAACLRAAHRARLPLPQPLRG